MGEWKGRKPNCRLIPKKNVSCSKKNDEQRRVLEAG